MPPSQRDWNNQKGLMPRRITKLLKNGWERSRIPRNAAWWYRISLVTIAQEPLRTKYFGHSFHHLKVQFDLKLLPSGLQSEILFRWCLHFARRPLYIFNDKQVMMNWSFPETFKAWLSERAVLPWKCYLGCKWCKSWRHKKWDINHCAWTNQCICARGWKYRTV